MTNTARQSVTTFDLILYRGNELHLLVTLPADFPMPAVASWGFYYNSTGMTPIPTEPTVTINEQTIELWLDTANLPANGFHTLYFDERAVLAGKVSVGRQTTNSPAPTDEHISLTFDETIPVIVQLLTTVIDASGEIEAPDYATIYELFKQV